jgi:hypothetical protein
MARWLVRLEGDPLDLGQLLGWFPDGEVHAIEEGAEVYFVGPAFEVLNEVGQVHGKALEVLAEFSAIISLVVPGFCRPAVGNVIREDGSGARKGFASASLRIAVRSSLRAPGESAGAGTDKKLPTQAQLLLQGCRSDGHLREAVVVLWADPTKNWPDLYRVLEEVEEYLGQKVHEAGFCSRNERTRFTHSANTAEVAGRGGRHASGQFAPPPRPMNLSEATSFVGRILRTALEEAVRRNLKLQAT